MSVLETSHPDMYAELNAGEFTVQCSSTALWQLPFDLTIEQRVNRDTKTHGWIIGFSRKPGADG